MLEWCEENGSGYANRILNQFHSFLCHYKVAFKDQKVPGVSELGLLIETDNLKKLPTLDICSSDRGSYYGAYPVNWFFERSDEEFFRLQKKFKNSMGLDLMLVFMKECSFLVEKDKRSYSRLAIKYSSYISKNDYDPFETKERHAAFNLATDVLCSMNIKDCNAPALNLLKRAIAANMSQEKVLKNLKTLLAENKSLSPSSKTPFEWIKKEIEHWDLNQVFTVAEQKMLYGKEGGVLSKRVEGIVYELDLNQIKTRYKNKAGVIGKNLRTFVKLLPEALGNVQNYVTSNHTFEDPHIQINISFEVGVKDMQIESINTIVEEIISSKTELTENYLKEKLEKGVLAAFFEDILPEKETQPKKHKI